MPNPVPAYRLHKPSGNAVVTLSGRDFYLGDHGTPASIAKYDRLVGEWQANGRRLKEQIAGATVAVLIAQYWQFAEGYYAGSPSAGELAHIRCALSHLRKLYGETLAAEFGPLALKTVRDSFVSAGWSRGYVNAQVYRIKRVYRWAAENEIVPGTVYHALQAVAGIRYGRSAARETEEVEPAPKDLLRCARRHVTRHVRILIDVQLLTGARPGEICSIRPRDIDRAGAVWTYTPASHKTKHHGHKRFILIGPKAQKLLTPFLAGRDPEACLFSPADAESERRAALTAARKTPPGQGNAIGTNRKRKPQRRPGTRYTVGAYRQAIERACARAFPPPPGLDATAAKAWQDAHAWTPHQLRHNAATRLRRDFGLEAAQVILGHKTLTVTQVYAARNVAAATKVIARIG